MNRADCEKLKKWNETARKNSDLNRSIQYFYTHFHIEFTNGMLKRKRYC